MTRPYANHVCPIHSSEKGEQGRRRAGATCGQDTAHGNPKPGHFFRTLRPLYPTSQAVFDQAALPKRIVFTDDDDATPTPQPSQAEQPERKPKRVNTRTKTRRTWRQAERARAQRTSRAGKHQERKETKKTKSESKHPDPQVDGVHHVADKAKEPDPPRWCAHRVGGGWRKLG